MYFRAVLALAAVLASGQLALADTTTTIDAKSNRGTWDGWGTSLAWWAKKFGSRDDLADVFFTLNTVSFSGQSLPGLGLNIVRYNAGACSWNTYNGTKMVASPNIKSSRQVEGFWLDWANKDPASSSWTWSVDANQRAMLSKAKSRGANHLELFSNSPMWWMTPNKNPSGASDGGENIQSWNLGDHALYLAAVAQYAKANWGITFESVDAMNEPIANCMAALLLEFSKANYKQGGRRMEPKKGVISTSLPKRPSSTISAPSLITEGCHPPSYLHLTSLTTTKHSRLGMDLVRRRNQTSNELMFMDTSTVAESAMRCTAPSPVGASSFGIVSMAKVMEPVNSSLAISCSILDGLSRQLGYTGRFWTEEDGDLWTPITMLVR